MSPSGSAGVPARVAILALTASTWLFASSSIPPLWPLIITYVVWVAFGALVSWSGKTAPTA